MARLLKPRLVQKALLICWLCS